MKKYPDSTKSSLKIVISSILGIVFPIGIGWIVLLALSVKMKQRRLIIASIALMAISFTSFTILCSNVLEPTGFGLFFVLVNCFTSALPLYYMKDYNMSRDLLYTVRYRKLNIENVKPGDDSLMLSEIYKDVELKQYEKVSTAIYGEKGIAVLYILLMIRNEEQVAATKRAAEEELRLKHEREIADKQMKEEQAVAAKRAAEEELRLKRERETAERRMKEEQIEKKRIEDKKAAEKRRKAEEWRMDNERRVKEAEAEKARMDAAKAEHMRKIMETELEIEKTKLAAAMGVNSQGVENENTIPDVNEHSVLDVNSCSESELAALPGIGIVQAKKAIAMRKDNGSFSSIEDFYTRMQISNHYRDLLSSRLCCKRRKTSTKGRRVDL